MVRLKEDGKIFIAVQDKFQFQYGAIKGIVGSGNKEGQKMFQFQYGAIKGKV